jgi:hypothetical protein
MQKPKFTARVYNIYFLSRIGSSLRWARQGLAPEGAVARCHMLERLDELEATAEQLSRPDQRSRLNRRAVPSPAHYLPQGPP